MDLTKLEKRKDYTPADKRISFEDAYKDLGNSFYRWAYSIALTVGHFPRGILVDMWRIVMCIPKGSASKEGSQFMGRATWWLLILAGALALLEKYLQ